MCSWEHDLERDLRREESQDVKKKRIFEIQLRSLLLTHCSLQGWYDRLSFFIRSCLTNRHQDWAFYHWPKVQRSLRPRYKHSRTSHRILFGAEQRRCPALSIRHYEKHPAEQTSYASYAGRRSSSEGTSLVEISVANEKRRCKMWTSYKEQQGTIRLEPWVAGIRLHRLLFRSVALTIFMLYFDGVIERSAGNRKTLPKRKSYSCLEQYQLAEIGVLWLLSKNLRVVSSQVINDGKRTISSERIRVLQRPEYKELNWDINAMKQRSS